MMALYDVRCPECGNEEEFDVQVRYKRGRPDRWGEKKRYSWKVQDIPGEQVVICGSCGAESSFEAAQTSYLESEEANQGQIMIPTDLDMGPCYLQTNGRGYSAPCLFIPTATYSMAGGPTATLGLSIGYSKPSGSSSAKVAAVLTLYPEPDKGIGGRTIWDKSQGKQTLVTLGAEHAYNAGTVPYTNAHPRSPQVPAAEQEKLLRAVYEAVADFGFAKPEFRSSNVGIPKGISGITPLSETEIETVELWMRFFDDLREHGQAVHRFDQMLPSGWRAELGYTAAVRGIGGRTMREPAILFSGRSPLRKQIPQGTVFEGLPVFYAGGRSGEYEEDEGYESANAYIRR